MRRLHLILGCFVVGLSAVAVLVSVPRMGWSPRTAVVLAFFGGVIYAGVLMVRGSWKKEREHQTQLTKLLDRENAAPAPPSSPTPPPSDRPGGTDPGDQGR